MLLPETIALRLSAHIAAYPPVPVELAVEGTGRQTGYGPAAVQHAPGRGAAPLQLQRGRLAASLRGTGMPCTRENGMHALRHYFASACQQPRSATHFRRSAAILRTTWQARGSHSDRCASFGRCTALTCDGSLELRLNCRFIRWLALAVNGCERLSDGPGTAQDAISAVTP